MRAILSVFDKSGVLVFAQGLVKLGVELYATEGTFDHLRESGIEAHSLEEIREEAVFLGGRLKTLHQSIYAAILARHDSPEEMSEIERQGITPFDIVCVNLFPFRQTVEQPMTSFAEAIQSIDVGGVALLRAAAWNHESILPICDPNDYEPVLLALHQLGVSAKGEESAWRRSLAAKAFQHTASYDSHVAGYLRGETDELPDHLTVALEKQADMRYGENPHQKGALYIQTPNPKREVTLVGSKLLSGKPLSFTDTLDVDTALICVREFAAMAVAIVRHGTPFGLAAGSFLPEVYRRAQSGDPQAAVGASLGFNRPVDASTARLIAQTFYEDVVAPGFSPEALEILKADPSLRIIQVEQSLLDEEAIRISPTLGLDFLRVSGGFLVQTPDTHPMDEASYETLSEREPTLDELTDLLFAWRAAKFVRSSGVVISRGLSVVGVGAGQPSRVGATELALRKAAERSLGAVMASDAYLSSPEVIEMAARGGITAIIQPGGSPRDEDIKRAADRHHIALVLTGFRHFRHR